MMAHAPSPDESESTMEENDIQPEAERPDDILRRIIDAFSRRKRVFIVIALVTFVAVQALAFFWPGTFSAKAALLIQKTRLASQINTSPDDPPTIMVASVSEEDVNSEVAILRSRDVIEETVRTTGLGLVPPPWYLRALYYPLHSYERLYAWYHEIPYPSDVERAKDGLQNAITAERLKDSDVLVVSYEAGDPEVAEIVLRELIAQYMERHLEVHTSLKAQPFFGTQAELLARELTQQEDELQELQSTIGAVDVESEETLQLSIDGALREESAVLNRRLAELEAKIAEYDTIVAEATEEDAFLAASPMRASILDDLKSQALQLELERIDLASRYKDDFPLVVDNRKKLEATRQALENERSNVREHSPTLAQVELEKAKAKAERSGLIDRIVVLEKQIENSRDRLMELEQTSVEITRKKRLITSLEERYMMYLSRGEQARIDDELDQKQVTNVSVVQAPVASLKPVSPKKTIVLLTSVVGAILMGFLVCLWLEIRAIGLLNLVIMLTQRETVS